jgi:ferredoxin-fold anticodon binding domain-containing protein
MAKRSKKNQKSQAKLKDFVVVTFAEDMEQAREYETLLRVNDIPAIIREQADPSLAAKSVAIMVPEDCLDEAHVVIESQDAYDDFYDFALENESDIEADIDNSFFEDEF